MLSQPSVLVVDDDLQILRMIEVVLTRASMLVDAVASGSSAIERLDSDRYAAIVLDLTMPKVSGFEVIAHLKKGRPELLRRVVVITAMTDTGIRRLDRSLIYSVLSKPFDIHKLVETVRLCIADVEQRMEPDVERLPVKNLESDRPIAEPERPADADYTGETRPRSDR